MTREELKQYITEAVDAMEQDDLEQLFPASQQPDLYSVIKELVGLRGEVRKLVQSSSEMNAQIRNVLENQKEQHTVAATPMMASNDILADKVGDDGIEKIIAKISHHDSFLKRLKGNFESLPELTMWNQSKFQKQFMVWKTEYEMAQKEWQQLVTSLETYKVQLQED